MPACGDWDRLAVTARLLPPRLPGLIRIKYSSFGWYRYLQPRGWWSMAGRPAAAGGTPHSHPYWGTLTWVQPTFMQVLCFLIASNCLSYYSSNKLDINVHVWFPSVLYLCFTCYIIWQTTNNWIFSKYLKSKTPYTSNISWQDWKVKMNSLVGWNYCWHFLFLPSNYKMVV